VHTNAAQTTLKEDLTFILFTMFTYMHHAASCMLSLYYYDSNLSNINATICGRN